MGILSVYHCGVQLKQKVLPPPFFLLRKWKYFERSKHTLKLIDRPFIKERRLQVKSREEIKWRISGRFITSTQLVTLVQCKKKKKKASKQTKQNKIACQYCLSRTWREVSEKRSFMGSPLLGGWNCNEWNWIDSVGKTDSTIVTLHIAPLS